MEPKSNEDAGVYVLPEGFGEALVSWYRENARELPWRRDRDPYRVWLSEVMLQQTRAEAVKAYYERFLARCPDVFALARCNDDELMKLWEGLGYYSRARRLKETAVAVASHGGSFPDTLEGLLSLPGIGPYTAGAIASICFDRPAPAVDGNVLRVVSRVTDSRLCIDAPDAKKRVEDALRPIYKKVPANELTQGLMELGATVCLPNAALKCEICPIMRLCAGCRENTASKLPVRAPKKARRKEERTIFLLRFNALTAVKKRPEKGLLAGLFELPNILSKLDAQSALDLAASWGVSPVSLLSTLEREHVFTHIVWHMTCHTIECANADERFLWASGEELLKSYALPTAFRMFL
ncbi:MAG TPA: A/G-specific adenine glycosylase [Clostridia bacterium]|nr:A/G-specific adenine glycosylase [Clostridia bacterium]